MSRNHTILVTGPELHPAATKVINERGYEAVYVPPYTPPEEMIKIVSKYDPRGILVRMGQINEDVINACPSLQVLSKHGVGVDNIDIPTASARGIVVINAVGANSKSVAEHGITLMLMAFKQSLLLDSSLREGRWIKPQFSATEVSGKNLGLVGFGTIAKHMGKIAKGFEMQVHAYDPFVPDDVFAELGVTRQLEVEDLLKVADVVSLHCPLMDATRQLINEARINLMKPGAIIINTARGGLIDEVALEQALIDGRIAAAGLDTFAVEPPPADHPFWKLGNVIVSPHVGGVTDEAAARVGVDAALGIIQVLENEGVDSVRVVNKKQLADQEKTFSWLKTA
ncbi:MAG: hydroxyacid dehydrogenase [Desulfuromonadales bacterium]|nr:hydroxyacid dehydrogenase [Desulfuromonadales bacterium]MBN2792021.1 hydroxyacid dehydrogenase [Desulfuromonadales bacterium]